MRENPHISGVLLRPAAPADAAAVSAIAREAFAVYVERIGREPEPMVVDYDEIVSRGGVMVAVAGREIIGYLEMYLREDHLFLDKIAVSRTLQGQGMAHLMYALTAVVAQAQGVRQIRLYTNANMHENIALYEQAAGFVITERRTEHGFDRVYMTRDLGI